MWVDKEMDTFDKRPQDPYVITEEQRKFCGKKFGLLEGKFLEEAFLKRIPGETAKLLAHGILDNDSKWRQAVGEITLTTRMSSSPRI